MTNAFTAKPDVSKWAKKARNAHTNSVNAERGRPAVNDIHMPGSRTQPPPKMMKRSNR